MKIWNINEIQALEIPDKSFYLKPLIFPQSLTMLYAPPGVGKTFMALWLAAACAGQGTYLKWKSECKGRVLYVDGEMGLEEIKSRVSQLAAGLDYPLVGDDFRFITLDDFNNGEIPHISDVKYHQFYIDAMKDREVLILDNYGCLTSRCGRENDEDVWNNSWKLIKKLRTQKKAIVIVHHAGKSGQQLGTSKKEQPLNWLIELSEPLVKTGPQLGARFDLKFKKIRGVRGPDLDNLSVNLIEGINGVRWEWQNLSSNDQELVNQMKKVGMTDLQISNEARLPLFEVKSLLNLPEVTPSDVGGTYYYDDSDKEIF